MDEKQLYDDLRLVASKVGKLKRRVDEAESQMQQLIQKYKPNK